MSLKILSGSANLPLTESIAKKLGVQLTRVVLERFPDSELHVEVQESVRGYDVYLIQPTCPPVDEQSVWNCCLWAMPVAAQGRSI